MPTRRDRLVARREALGYSQEALAEAICVSAESVARWERGLTKPRATHRRPLADRLQVTLPELERLLDSQGKSLPVGHSVPAWLSHYASLEQGAARLQTFESTTIPGLVQTAAYAKAVMELRREALDVQVIADRVEARMARQAVLDRQPEPLELICVIDEMAITRQTDTPETMANQLDHLLEMSLRPTIQIQIYPGPPLHDVTFGSFQLFTSADTALPFMACTEDLSGINYVGGQAAIEAHVELFEHLARIALPPDQSAELIKITSERYRMTHEPTEHLAWRKSSFSSADGQCVEIADINDSVLVRNSNRLSLGTMPFTKAELSAFVAGCKAGEFDDLA